MFGFLKKKASATAQVPSVQAEPERYAGRPLLIVLENVGAAAASERQYLR
ncbi:MAG: hypothetical protein KJZ78_17100 [Bryobacteraceae bacterium]|nr:hypothetical protein [Bryobacteraceae bacterium]